MYLARVGDHYQAVLLPPIVKSLSDLRLEPHLSYRTRSPTSIDDLLSLIELWSSARLTGDLLSVTVRRAVLRTLVQYIFALIGGKDWELAERLFQDRRDLDALQNLARAISTKLSEASLIVTLSKGVLLSRILQLASVLPALPRSLRGTSHMTSSREQLHRKSAIL